MKTQKLWETGKSKLNPIIEAFETGGDLLMDQKLIKYDCLASAAHVKMLHKINILSKDELKDLEEGLKQILELVKEDKFKLVMGDEDMHTKIENYLTEKYGEAGQKIHTGRSRNDQVLTAIRLYNKEMMENIKQELNGLIKSFENFSKKYGSIKMPGYTHMQKAMPSSIGLWAGSFMDSFKDDCVLLNTAMELNDQSPLGSAAGYGTLLKLDREYTAKLLGFAKKQNNFLYCQNSKGKIEAVILAALTQILLTINKFASDIMLFTTTEFNFFQVSDKVTTGSSMMPQKKNLDVAELLRSKVHVVLGNYTQLVSLSSNLISGYNRDLQDMKKPLLESLEIALDSIKAVNILLNNLTPNKKIMEGALTEEIFAAEKAFELVKKGISFRKAYQEVKNI
ncbi:MAG: argininosuccinate lyase [Candidatus Daviesbacteria bacterium]|nr:argininosuccinate lyase [Candidatus Daviesbacteria bacterium]